MAITVEVPRLLEVVRCVDLAAAGKGQRYVAVATRYDDGIGWAAGELVGRAVTVVSGGAAMAVWSMRPPTPGCGADPTRSSWYHGS